MILPNRRKITYRELHDHVCRWANVLRNRNVEKGDRVTIYLPMIPEAAYAMLACARLGAIHSVVFGGFSPDSLAGRIEGCGSKTVITADEGLRGGRKVPLKANVDAAIARLPEGAVDHVVVVKRTGGDVTMEPGRDVYYNEAAEMVTADCPCEEVNAEDPLFILYTSRLHRQPQGRPAFDRRLSGLCRDDASIRLRLSRGATSTGARRMSAGSPATATSSTAPLANGATTLMFEGVPTYPSISRFWDVVDKHQVNIFYTAPHRHPLADGRGRGAGEEDFAQEPAPARLRRRADQSGSLGMVLQGRRRRALSDRRYLVADRDRRHPDHAASRRHRPEARLGHPALLRGEAGHRRCRGARSLRAPAKAICASPTAGRARCAPCSAINERFIQTYFSTYPGKYFTGDGCRRDADGYYWITGRVDDVINVSGHRMGTAEVESALVAHPKVSEAAVVGYPHDIKGQGIYAYVTLMAGEEPSDALRKELVTWVRKGESGRSPRQT